MIGLNDVNAFTEGIGSGQCHGLMAEVNRLRARVRELEAAIQPFARIKVPEDAPGDSWLCDWISEADDPLVNSARRAAEVLRETADRLEGREDVPR
jgi:hypothetical protein